MIKKIQITISMLIGLQTASFTQSTEFVQQAENSLQKAVQFFHSINSHGGYVYFVTPDLSRRWGESPKDAETIEVQPLGTPAVGQSFLKVYKLTGSKFALDAAKDAAYALINGQNQNGGWNHTINFANLSNEIISFDDNQTQSAVSFLMALDQEMDDPKLSAGVDKALKMMVTTQLENGGWPHQYPHQGNYRDYATFNDEGINDCIRVMIEAHKYYGQNKEVEKSLLKAARFMNISQLPPPQLGWAQQYNEYLQPAWARTFEPPSVCPLVTVKNINTLIDLYLVLEDKTLLEPIPDAIRWLKEIKMENGNWARFVELGTNKALYYDRPRIRVNSMEELHPERRTGYRYEIDIEKELEQSSKRYHKASNMSLEEFRIEEANELSKNEMSKLLKEFVPEIEKIIKLQDASGRWITKNDRFKAIMPKGVRWNGQYEEMDRISSEVFNANVDALYEFIGLSKQLGKY